MCCKNEYLKVCPGRVLQGHTSDVCLASLPAPSLLPPALPSSLCYDGCPGEADITGALQLCAPLSRWLFTPKGPQTKSAQSETGLLRSLHFLQGSPSHWTQRSPRSSPTHPCPKTGPVTVLFHKTELFQEDYHDQSKVTVLS